MRFLFGKLEGRWGMANKARNVADGGVKFDFEQGRSSQVP